ncbi:MAG: orotidine 5'-phosphate decarboxylase [Nitrososphaeria archaeon]
MAFAQRMRVVSTSKKSRVVVGLDLRLKDPKALKERAKQVIVGVHDKVCAVKVNFHLLLPLGIGELTEVVNEAHCRDLPVIADIKLNDISSTNLVATEILWDIGFDAVICNPFVGFEEGLGPSIEFAHRRGKGVILLAYMSHRGAVEGYGLDVVYGGELCKIYDVFVRRAVNWKADGLIVGATNPQLISHVRENCGGIPIFSPGLITQGGDPREAVKAGADYLIVARAIAEAVDPSTRAKEIQVSTW